MADFTARLTAYEAEQLAERVARYGSLIGRQFDVTIYDDCDHPTAWVGTLTEVTRFGFRFSNGVETQAEDVEDVMDRALSRG